MVIQMTNTQETTILPSIDIILKNLQKDPNFYNSGMSEAKWMQECNRED